MGHRQAWSPQQAIGRGPLLSALPDIKSINVTKKLILQNASLAISGVYTAADDGVLNPETVSVKPGSIIPVARNGGPQGESLKALPRGGDFNVGQMVLEDLKMSIKQILLDDTLPSDNMSARTATEMSHRISTLATQMGASFGRSHNRGAAADLPPCPLHHGPAKPDRSAAQG